ncbi:hypothetical protein C5167_045984 [Papaver somniferum]|uniref:Uncharacterized protein n=1 Tax=Papaver somniferum TaxID=3469 RepID=A0A4Y7LCF6_PAPSO|nr:hypothetical protein C5167_045984 [Papaver somniferum]
MTQLLQTLFSNFHHHQSSAGGSTATIVTVGFLFLHAIETLMLSIQLKVKGKGLNMYHSCCQSIITFKCHVTCHSHAEGSADSAVTVRRPVGEAEKDWIFGENVLLTVQGILTKLTVYGV